MKENKLEILILTLIAQQLGWLSTATQQLGGVCFWWLNVEQRHRNPHDAKAHAWREPTTVCSTNGKGSPPFAGASLQGNPILAPIESASDGFKVPSLLRNQGIRHGSALAGQALYTAGGAITARGLSLSRSQTSVKRRKSSVVTKQQARTAERMGGQKYNPSKYDYRPERSSSAQRWLKRRYKPKPTRVPRGTLHIRAGSTMMVAGRILPVLGV